VLPEPAAPAAAAPAPDASPESAPSEAASPAAVPSPAPAVVPTDPAREAVVNDLLWLTHEGYVVEYGDSRLESVPLPKNPPKPVVAAAESVPAPDPVVAPDPAPVPLQDVSNQSEA
jgi:hypothetical protein